MRFCWWLSFGWKGKSIYLTFSLKEQNKKNNTLIVHEEENCSISERQNSHIFFVHLLLFIRLFNLFIFSLTGEAGSCTNTHTLFTHTLQGGHSRRWSWPLRSHSRGGKHTPFLASDQQHGGLLRPLERREEIQRVGLVMWIPCNLTSYRETKCCLKSSRHVYRCQRLVLEDWIMLVLVLNSWISLLLRAANFSP